jgi:Domain of unknown function (DUF4124)
VEKMKKIILLSLLLFTHTASAKVYMCVDHATGKTSFTDKACETVHSSSEEVRVDPSNLESGRKYGTEKRSRVEKVWNSQRDERKTGREFNAERSEPYKNAATAQVD